MSERDTGNSLGVVGFVFSILGLISCGIFSPVGLILCLIAITKKSDGLTVAGLILGIIGSFWVIIALIFGLFAAILAAFGVAMGAAGP